MPRDVIGHSPVTDKMCFDYYQGCARLVISAYTHIHTRYIRLNELPLQLAKYMLKFVVDLRALFFNNHALIDIMMLAPLRTC